jgi:DNA-binding PadR family transcriptional regulator
MNAEMMVSTGTAVLDGGPPASVRDDDGTAVHRDRLSCGGRRRWLTPFVLALLTEGPAHGYVLITRLREMGVSESETDAGQVYKTLRCLEGLGLVRSDWSTEATGPRHRDYELTEAGCAALDEWAGFMEERTRLIGEFADRYRRWKER